MGFASLQKQFLQSKNSIAPPQHDLTGLQNELFGYTLQVWVIAILFAIWMVLNHKPFSVWFILFWIVSMMSSLLIQQVQYAYPTLARILFIMLLDAGLVGAMLVFVFLQRYFVRDISMSGIKA